MTIVDLPARLIGAGLVLVLLVASITAASAAQEQATHDAGPNTAAQTEPAETGGVQLPNSPGTTRSQTDDSARSQTSEPQVSQQPTGAANEPAGTAAAESVKTTGVAASKPAGAAIAPAKQRRVRSILIGVGAIVGAGVAVGATAALSKASPSKPPGH
jgi:cytoskeletal protein RodZ